MTRTEAKRLATRNRNNCETLPRGAGRDLHESWTWDQALDVLLAWSREAVADVKLSRDLLSLASWLTRGSRRRQRLYDKARSSPELSLKCAGCNADQDAWGGTCYANKRHFDACGFCEECCTDCDGDRGWIRPDKDERLTSCGQWVKTP